MRRLAVIASILAALLSAPAALGAEPKTTLTAVENEVMCVVCGVPLNVANSPQADRQRAYISELIAEGKTKDEIKAALVAQYGQQVLADPESDGFAITSWLVPALLLVVLAGAAIVLLPRWRRRSRAAPAPAAPALPDLDDADRRRLEEDLARYR